MDIQFRAAQAESLCYGLVAKGCMQCRYFDTPQGMSCNSDKTDLKMAGNLPRYLNSQTTWLGNSCWLAMAGENDQSLVSPPRIWRSNVSRIGPSPPSPNQATRSYSIRQTGRNWLRSNWPWYHAPFQSRRV